MATPKIIVSRRPLPVHIGVYASSIDEGHRCSGASTHTREFTGEALFTNQLFNKVAAGSGDRRDTQVVGPERIQAAHHEGSLASGAENLLGREMHFAETKARYNADNVQRWIGVPDKDAPAR